MEKLVKSFYLIFLVIIIVFFASYALKSGLLSTLGLSRTAFRDVLKCSCEKKREAEVDD